MSAPLGNPIKRTVYAVAFPSGGASQVMMAGDIKIHGWAWVETTGGAAATINLFDGGNNGGTLLAPITLTAGQSTRDVLNELGLDVLNGLFVEVVAGSVRGSVWIEDV